MPIIGTTPDAIDLAEDRERFQQLLDQLRPAAAAERHRPHRRRGACDVARRDRLSRCSCARPTCSAAARWRSCYDEDDLRALHDRRGPGLARQPGADRPVPRGRDRGRRRRDLRRQGRAASAASWSTSRRPASTPATPPARCRRTALTADLQAEITRPDRAAGAGARRHRPDERAVRGPERRSSTCSRSTRAPRAPCRSSPRPPACRWRRSPRRSWPARRSPSSA